jgi:hypothetical protein
MRYKLVHWSSYLLTLLIAPVYIPFVSVRWALTRPKGFKEWTWYRMVCNRLKRRTSIFMAGHVLADPMGDGDDAKVVSPVIPRELAGLRERIVKGEVGVEGETVYPVGEEWRVGCTRAGMGTGDGAKDQTGPRVESVPRAAYWITPEGWKGEDEEKVVGLYLHGG